jgi:hypothetical protein
MRYPTFEQFVMEAPHGFGRLRRPQLDYLRARHGRVDFIGRNESFDDDVWEVCERLRIAAPVSVPRINAGPAASYRDHFTPAMRRRVAELFAPDIREFGYEF